MNSTATQITTADLANFAEMIRPTFDRLATDDTLTAEDRLLAAALITRDREEKRNIDALASVGTPNGLFANLIDALMGTYDEFRAEDGAS